MNIYETRDYCYESSRINICMKRECFYKTRTEMSLIQEIKCLYKTDTWIFVGRPDTKIYADKSTGQHM